MKVLNNSFTTLVAICSFIVLSYISCSKDNDDPQTTAKYPIEGLWIGTYTVNGNTPAGQQYFSLVIKPDGKMISDTKSSGNQNQNLCLGTWTLSGTSFTSTYTSVYGEAQNLGINQKCTGVWDSIGKLTGTWQNLSADNTTGTFTVTRVN